MNKYSADELVSLGSFKNEYGELFVVLTMRESGGTWITGDETAWEPVKLPGDFILSEDELKEIKKIVKK